MKRGRVEPGTPTGFRYAGAVDYNCHIDEDWVIDALRGTLYPVTEPKKCSHPGCGTWLREEHKATGRCELHLGKSSKCDWAIYSLNRNAKKIEAEAIL